MGKPGFLGSHKVSLLDLCFVATTRLQEFKFTTTPPPPKKKIARSQITAS